MDRRNFIKIASPITVLLASGKVAQASESWWRNFAAPKVALRFAIASDGHYGQPGTAFENFFSTMVQRVNEEHAISPFAFTMINGDIIHDDKAHFPGAKKALDNLKMKYYVSQGNHDHASPAEWEAVWGMPLNYTFAHKRNAFITGTTSNEKGEYLCPDMAFMEKALHENRKKENIFVFIHINPAKQTANAVDCPPFLELLSKYKNVRAVFNGHDHDKEGVLTKNNIPFIFSAHFGGSWGTAYRGFRVVEVLDDNTVVTYILDPVKRINEATLEAIKIS
ncbi:MAG: metallophosphoesterase [Chitinophagaceae bacterium]|nr:metallophosphoesterase [Chitinophagaceae bacterium]